MKAFLNISLSLLLLGSTTVAMARDATMFTTLAFPSEKVGYVAVKKMSTGHESMSSLLEIKTEKMVAKKIELPADLAHREVVSLIPTKSGKLLVLTQYTMERGDHPRLHLFDPGKKSWVSVGEVACISFMKLKTVGDKILFSCEETAKNGDVKIVEKEIVIKHEVTLEKEEMTLPIAKLSKGVLQGQFEGLPQEWEKLKLTYKGKEKVFTP